MRRSRAAKMLVVLALLLPSRAQEDEAVPYFSLSSSRTFAPGEQAAISAWAEGAKSLEFRVYRVRDAIRFFDGLEDLHQFGGAAPRPPRERTALEKFRAAKRRWRNQVRDLFRAQFSPHSRVRIRAFLESRGREPARPAAQFAQVPVLNSQQLVTTWRQTISTGRRWESQTVPVDVPGKGLYLVEATDGQRQAYTIVLVTPLAVISKSAPGRVMAAVVDRQTGRPLPGVEVRVRSRLKELARPVTAEDGTIDVRLEEEEPEDPLVLAASGDDIAVSSLSSWNLRLRPWDSWTGYIYTDRPVYRPSHTVHIKALIRERTPEGYRLPPLKTLDLEVQDPEGKKVHGRRPAVSPMGTIQASYALPASALLGYYPVLLRTGDRTMHGGFHVEEYKKPEYEVRVSPRRGRVLQGEPIEAAVEARYYYGEPVANAKVTYAVYRSRWWNPAAGREEDFGDEGESEEGFGWDREQVLEAAAQLDAEGRVNLSIPTQVLNEDSLYRIEARVTDAGNREVSGGASAVATYGSFWVEARPEQFLYSPREAAVLLFTARDYEGRPVATRLRVDVHGFVAPDKEQVIGTLVRETDASGQGRVELTFAEPGMHRVRVSAMTPEKREVTDTTWVWITGRDTRYVSTRAARVQIVPDKRSYAPGETARVLVITGVPEAHVLFSVEGRQLHSARIISAREPSVLVEVPVRSEYAPEFFVTASFIRDNQLYQGAKRIAAPPVEQELSVQVESSKPQFVPGEPALYTITARDYQGRPVSAEFSLGVVDEAIYAIRPDAARDIVKFFYGRSYNRVGTESSLSYYFHGASGRRRMQLTQLRPTRALAQLKPERLLEPKIRKAFPDTALWLAAVTTGRNGRAQARLEFPDSLTTWRATARGITADTKVGSALHKVVVRKNLILSPAVPRFLTLGDQVTASALVRNYLEEEKTARVSLEVQGAELQSPAAHEVRIARRGQAQVDFLLRAGQVRDATLLAKALTNEESDAVQLSLPVHPYGVKVTLARAGALTGAGSEAAAEIDIPEASDPASRTLEISVAPSVAGALLGALEYLTTFPYGCTEQTMSSFLPNVIVSRALAELGVKSGVDPDTLHRKIRAGLDRLYDFQHDDGGWGWWKTDESALFMTAYVLSGLGQAKAAGHQVRQPVIERGKTFLEKAVAQEPRLAPDLLAFAILALAFHAEADEALFLRAWDEREKMSSYGRALLGLALDSAGRSASAAEIARRLETEATASESEAMWKADRDDLMDFYGDTSPEATACALKLLVKHRSTSPLLPKAALWLMAHRNEGSYWSSTKQTAMVLYGLTDYLKVSGELKPNFEATVWVNQKQVYTKRFGETDVSALTGPPVRLGPDALKPGSNSIRIVRTGPGAAYWSARATYYSSEQRLEQKGSVRLNVLREYFRLEPVQEKDKIVWAATPLEGEVKPGDILSVRLTVSGGPWRYLQVEDPIPAGTEFIERDDLYPRKDRPAGWTEFYSRREFHDDRVAIFQTYFETGQKQYSYLLKVVTPGRFRVSPTRVQPMYQPEHLASSQSHELVVRPLNAGTAP